jgi:hypothetical protein
MQHFVTSSGVGVVGVVDLGLGGLAGDLREDGLVVESEDEGGAVVVVSFILAFLHFVEDGMDLRFFRLELVVLDGCCADWVVIVADVVVAEDGIDDVNKEFE